MDDLVVRTRQTITDTRALLEETDRLLAHFTRV
jgi:hypothetical protein